MPAPKDFFLTYPISSHFCPGVIYNKSSLKTLGQEAFRYPNLRPDEGGETRSDDLDVKWNQLQAELTNETGGDHLLRIPAKQENLHKIQNTNTNSENLLLLENQYKFNT